MTAKSLHFSMHSITPRQRNN